MYYCLGFCLIFFFNLLHAETIFPSGCQTLAISGETAELAAKKASLFILHNKSKNDLWLTHTSKDEGASAGWTSKLQADHSAALATDQAFSLNCIESLPGHEQQIPCKEVLEICKYRKAHLPKHSQGVWWVAEDLPMSTLKASLAARNISEDESE